MKYPDVLCIFQYKQFNMQPISGRLDRASAAKTIEPGSIPGRVKLNTVKLVFTASLLDVQY